MRLPADTDSSWDGSSMCVFAPRQRHCCPLTRLLNLTSQPVCDVVLHTAGPEALRPRWRPSPSCGMQQVPPSQMGDVPQKGNVQRRRPVTKLSCTRLRGMFPGRPLISLSVAALITISKAVAAGGFPTSAASSHPVQDCRLGPIRRRLLQTPQSSFLCHASADVVHPQPPIAVAD